MLTRKKIQNNWSCIKIEMLKHWQKLTPAEVEKTQGSLAQIYHLVHEKYGYLENFYAEFEKVCDKCATEYYKKINLEEELYEFLKAA